MNSDRGAIIAIIVDGIITVLLSVRDPVHQFADRIEENERRASAKFILVVLVVLPALPDRSLEVLCGPNPRFIWLMIAFVTRNRGEKSLRLAGILVIDRGLCIS